MAVTKWFAGTVLTAVLAATPVCAAEILGITITTAVTAQVGTSFQYRPFGPEDWPKNALIQCNFTFGSGGTSADAWVQTSIDGGVTWTDVANCHFLVASARVIMNVSAQTPIAAAYTPTDGTLAANTAKDGIIGNRWRVKYTTVGTYAGGTTLVVSLLPGNLTTP